MTRIGITQRVEVIEEYDERRDCLDQAWTPLLQSRGYTPIPLPNTVDDVESYLSTLRLDGLLITGGNDLAGLSDATSTAPKRDAFERAALAYALEVGLPVLGVCRGIQLLNVYFDGSLSHVDGHVATDHPLVFDDRPSFLSHNDITVNSYHDYGIADGDEAAEVDVIARAEDGTVEFLTHPEYDLYGVMWHPERDSSPAATKLNDAILGRLFE
jgi:gamma-glutamyl-gamma-aminobutyrate hydrolase PuuD